jgi:hypothetical protein
LYDVRSHLDSIKITSAHASTDCLFREFNLATPTCNTHVQVPGSAAEFLTLRSAIDQLDKRLRPLLIGPDSAMTTDSLDYFVPLATKIIRGCGNALDAASFHTCV